MKHVADGESVASDRDASELGSGVRDASGTQPLDPPTQELELANTEPDTSVRPAPSPALPIARSTSVPPPLPAEALRARPVGTPQPVPALQVELERALKRMRERDAYLAELEELYTQRSEAFRKAQTQIEALQARVAELEAQLAAAPPSASGDDLTRIRGIGPRFARALQALGMGSFASIAGWTDDEVALVARQLNIAPARIGRDRWIEQARELLSNS